jgi:hypothetical protein
MSDLTTITQHLARELHLDTTSSGTQATADIKRAVVDAQRLLETECPWFLITEYTIPLVSDQFEYPLPYDYESIDQSVYFVPALTEPKVKWPIRLVPLESVKSRLSTGFEWESTVDQGDPSVVAVDTARNLLIVAPTPDSSLSGLEVRIYRRGNIPYYKYDGSTWTFYGGDTSTALASTFTNIWLQEAYMLVFYRAAQMLVQGVYGGTDGSVNKAQLYLQAYSIELNKLRGKATRLGSVNYVPRHI